MQREYEEFKVRINVLVSTAQKVPEEGWTMQDGTPWPGNNVRDHPGMIQVRIFFAYIWINAMIWVLAPLKKLICMQSCMHWVQQGTMSYSLSKLSEIVAVHYIR